LHNNNILSFLKIRTGAVSCKQMTMIYPVQCLLFAPCKVQTNESLISIDDWWVYLLFTIKFFGKS